MKNNKLVVLLMLSFFCINISAAERKYKIELLVFSQDMATTEVFEQADSQIKWPRHVSPLSSYKKVNSSLMKLTGSYNRLVKGQNYQPLMHVAWVQSVQSNSLSRAVKISNPQGNITGFFRLQRGHLVHMIADIEYSKDSVIYRLNEKRRFKLNETHYLDHPKFGVLAIVSPISD